MIAARLHGPRDVRIEQLPEPPPPGPGEVKLRFVATGICGSDLHTYEYGAIGDARVTAPLVPGHECSAVVEECGRDANDALGKPLHPGTRVAVDPAIPCGECDMCLNGQHHLCRRLHFLGHPPDDGSLRSHACLPARQCFPLADDMTDEQGALLEPLGVAIHAARLAAISAGESVAILGAGSIGLLILQVVRAAQPSFLLVADPLPWRKKLAAANGATLIRYDGAAGIAEVMELTHGRGVDVVIEAAWGGTAIDQAIAIARPGGRVVLVGIPGDDVLETKHSIARRKELSLLFSRRMNRTYPEAFRLVRDGRVSLDQLVSHRFPLERAAEAFALNHTYADNVVKIIIRGAE
jgi:L-iditol 2-dehydrogenase